MRKVLICHPVGAAVQSVSTGIVVRQLTTEVRCEFRKAPLVRMPAGLCHAQNPIVRSALKIAELAP